MEVILNKFYCYEKPGITLSFKVPIEKDTRIHEDIFISSIENAVGKQIIKYDENNNEIVVGVVKNACYINEFIFVETDIPVDNFAELQQGIISSFSIGVKYN